ncbi:hypothetical protein [Amycolatopsis sp. 195334CR]|uniref:hypothetical protein n=1 Tax=Amycolatopsis sp. 195334CR TaxID=2814588 RepID=UPI001F5E2112|nr:hypothetical protein [Amycolatopsis sp. 195334CR]
MRTWHIGLRVAELGRSLAFYTAVGYDVNPVEVGTDVSHFVVQVESMADTLAALAGHGIEPITPAA